MKFFLKTDFFIEFFIKLKLCLLIYSLFFLAYFNNINLKNNLRFVIKKSYSMLILFDTIF